jgi:Ca-activated chloride channel family protein
VRRRSAAAALLAIAALAPAPGPGQTPPGLTFGSAVGMVRLDVTVAGAHGRFVTDLREEDFEIYEDGRRQAAASFLRQELPVSLVLLVDASNSVTDRMPLTQAATKHFVAALRPDDQVRVVAFNDRVSVLQELTSDRAALGRAIDGIAAGGSTALYNALYSTFRNLPPPDSGGRLRRRVIVLLSDGEDTASLVWEEQVLELVRRREATIHVIALREEGASNRSARLLRLLSGESGGEVHHPGSIRDLDSVYARIGDELRSQYNLGYVSSNPLQDGAWRRIELRVRGRKDLQVRHRTGYYGLP